LSGASPRVQESPRRASSHADRNTRGDTAAGTSEGDEASRGAKRTRVEPADVANGAADRAGSASLVTNGDASNEFVVEGFLFSLPVLVRSFQPLIVSPSLYPSAALCTYLRLVDSKPQMRGAEETRMGGEAMGREGKGEGGAVGTQETATGETGAGRGTGRGRVRETGREGEGSGATIVAGTGTTTGAQIAMVSARGFW
ncbi:unnamed protein product, partial [Closterium sp. NIES-53]